MKKVAIIQSSYLPWKGYFDIINEVDTFVFYDCVQFTKRDWRTRNFIIKQINVPVNSDISKPINEIIIDTKQSWQEEHFKGFEMNYGKAKFFKEFKFILNELYKKKKWQSLSDLNQHTIIKISKLLGIKTEFIDSRKLELKGNKTDRLIDALKKIGATEYISGPSAKNYIEDEKFKRAGIKIIYKDYSNYPQYTQLWGDFKHNVNILDLIFNTGKKAPYYIWK